MLYIICLGFLKFLELLGAGERDRERSKLTRSASTLASGSNTVPDLLKQWLIWIQGAIHPFPKTSKIIAQ